MFYQIEITTFCNYECFYCAGRRMPQKHMDTDLFKKILESIPQKTVVNLQGEGEPSLHPNFWDLVNMVKEHKCQPFTITNGSLLKPENVPLILRYFPRIGVSIDSLSNDEKTGRFHQEKTFSTVKSLCKTAGRNYVELYITDYGQNIVPLANDCRLNKIRFVIQKLQTKPDYVHGPIYKQKLGNNSPQLIKENAICRFMKQNVMRFYNVNGLVFPCCFIKNESTYMISDKMVESFNRGIIPECCLGCRELKTLKGQ